MDARGLLVFIPLFFLACGEASGGGDLLGGAGPGGSGSGGAGGDAPGGSGGTIPAAEIVAIPGALDLGEVCAGGTARAGLVLENRGDLGATVRLSSRELSIDPSEVDLPAGEAARVAVRAESGAPASGVIELGTAGEVPWQRTVAGVEGRPGVLCGDEAPCAVLELPPVALGSFSTATFEVVNDGCAAFDVTSIAVRDDAALPAPDLVIDRAVPIAVAPGARVTITATFTPGAAGPRRGDIVFHTSTADLDSVVVPWEGAGY